MPLQPRPSCDATAASALSVKLADAVVTTSLRAKASRRALQASNKPDPALAAPHNPTEPGVAGKSLSPSSIFTLSSGRPSISAATWLSMV